MAGWACVRDHAAAFPDLSGLWLFSRRVLLRRLRRASRLGLRRPAAARRLRGSRVAGPARRFALRAALLPRPVARGSRARRWMDGARPRRAPLRATPHRGRGSLVAGLLERRHAPHHERLRPALLGRRWAAL